MKKYITLPNYDQLMQERRYLGLIPARGGSKRIPDKNIRPLNGKPLIQYTIEAALGCGRLWKVIVSTDDERIAKISKSCGAEVPFMRPSELATDEATTSSVVRHAIEHYGTRGEMPDGIVLLQPTSPLRTSRDITGAIELFERSGADTVISVCDEPVKTNALLAATGTEPFLRLEMTGREASKEVKYRLNGAIYVVRPSLVLEKNTIFGKQLVGYPMPAARSIDVDTMADWLLVEHLMSGGKR
jgi:CMP-N-acetylneuraminic acid synthetase